jgi:hypothetical protein
MATLVSLNFRGVAISCWTIAKKRVSGVFVFTEDGVSAPPRKAIKTVLAFVIRRYARKLCAEADPERASRQTDFLRWPSIMIESHAVI